MNLREVNGYKIHPLSDVQTNSIGKGTTVWQFCVILTGARIGSNCNINASVFIENDVIIGDNVTIKCGVQLWDGIRVGNSVQIGPNVTFTNDRFPKAKHEFVVEETVVHQGASIGANSTICPGLSIGKHSLIGAGSVVTKDVEPFAVVQGNPAVRNGYITENRIRISEDLMDEEGNVYLWSEGGTLVKATQ